MADLNEAFNNADGSKPHGHYTHKFTSFKIAIKSFFAKYFCCYISRNDTKQITPEEYEKNKKKAKEDFDKYMNDRNKEVEKQLEKITAKRDEEIKARVY